MIHNAFAICQAARLHDPDVPNLPRPDAIVERPQSLLHGRERIEAMKLVQVDMVELQAPQAFVHRVEDVHAGEAGLVGARPIRWWTLVASTN